MYKVIWLVKFRPDVEHDEVLSWWRGHHGDVAAKTPGMVRYVQNHWVAALDPETQMPVAGGEPAFDGHAEHWFESREA
jgi:EthD domain